MVVLGLALVGMGPWVGVVGGFFFWDFGARAGPVAAGLEPGFGAAAVLPVGGGGGHVVPFLGGVAC